jgi:hypothetical protein
VTDDWGINKVVFPTWTLQNDQDDLAENFMNTQKGTKNGDTYIFQVKASEHNNEQGQYVTHIYAIDKGGNQTQLVLDVVDIKDSATPEPDVPVADKITLTVPSVYTLESSLIQNVTSDTTVQTLLTQFRNEDLEVLDRNGNILSDLDVVGTGAVINLRVGGVIVDSAQVVVLGDVDGNGIVDATDYLRIKANFLGSFDMNAAEFAAADVDKNGYIETTDYVRIKSHFLGEYELYY